MAAEHRTTNRLLAVLSVSVMVGACGVDHKKFDATVRAGKAIQVAAIRGVNLSKYRELSQAFDTEISIARGRAKGPADENIVAAYAEAAASYHDALVVWQLTATGATEWIFGGPTLDKVLRPYAIEWEVHGDVRRAHAADALQAIWNVALKKLTAADALLNVR